MLGNQYLLPVHHELVVDLFAGGGGASTGIEQAIPALIADDLFSRDASQVPLELLNTLNYVTQVAPSFSLRGGTREILRGMIARGLGLR